MALNKNKKKRKKEKELKKLFLLVFILSAFCLAVLTPKAFFV
jgi:hypothetical protein